MNPTLRVDDPLIGRPVYGGYVIERKLGEGGMGAVYAALDRDLDKRIAVKVLLPMHSSNADVVTRFIGEAKAASRIGHDNIVRIEAKGTLAGGCAYVAMEYLDGVGLDAYLESHPQLPYDQALAILVQVGAALDAAHARGIVHRDIKPPNIFVTHKPGMPLWIKVLDFGIARFLGPKQATGVTRQGVVVGTPAFMPPEQAVGSSEIDHRADIYALGVLAHLMVAGVLPQEATHRVELAPGWSQAIEWALEFHPASRPPRVVDWIRALIAATPNGTAIAETYAPGFARGDRTPSPPAIVSAPTIRAVPTTLGSAAGTVATAAPRPRRTALYAVVVAASALLAFAIPMIARERADDAVATATRDARVAADAAVDVAIDAAIDASPAIDAATPMDAATSPPDAKRRPAPVRPRPRPQANHDRATIPTAPDDIIE